MLEVGFAFFLDAEQADKLDTLIRPVNRLLQRTYRPKRRVCLRNERVRNRRKIAETRRRNRFPFKNRIGQRIRSEAGFCNLLSEKTDDVLLRLQILLAKIPAPVSESSIVPAFLPAWRRFL